MSSAQLKKRLGINPDAMNLVTTAPKADPPLADKTRDLSNGLDVNLIVPLSCWGTIFDLHVVTNPAFGGIRPLPIPLKGFREESVGANLSVRPNLYIPPKYQGRHAGLPLRNSICVRRKAPDTTIKRAFAPHKIFLHLFFYSLYLFC